MRKIIIIICMIVMLVLSTSFVFADELDEPVIGDDISEYAQANTADAYLSISSGKAICTTTITTKNTSTVNKMVVTTYYYKSNGTYIGYGTVTVNNSGHYFSGSTSKSLSSHGSYYAEALVKLYHNSQFIESFTLLTGNATYWLKSFLKDR